MENYVQQSYPCGCADVKDDRQLCGFSRVICQEHLLDGLAGNQQRTAANNELAALRRELAEARERIAHVEAKRDGYRAKMEEFEDKWATAEAAEKALKLIYDIAANGQTEPTRETAALVRICTVIEELKGGKG